MNPADFSRLPIRRPGVTFCLALRELRDPAGIGNQVLRDAIIGELKEFCSISRNLNGASFHATFAISGSSALKIRSAAAAKLNRFFMRGELEGTDLYGAYFETQERTAFRSRFHGGGLVFHAPLMSAECIANSRSATP
jgi:hypothetical protein